VSPALPAAPSLRPARLDDFPAVLVVNASAAPGVTPLARSDLLTLLEAGARLDVAEAAGRVVGYLLAFPAGLDYAGDEFAWFRDAYGDEFVYVDQVAVAPAWRGRGVGSRLYEGLEAWVRRWGIPRVTCEVSLLPPNPGSQRFHQRRGYREVGTLHTADGRVVSLRSKALEA
jgi:predicted GNAT superfamily acetyltransferase